MQHNPYQAPSDMGAPAGAAGVREANYEFDEIENQTLDQTARRSTTWGIFSLIIGAFAVIAVGVVIGFANEIADQFNVSTTIVHQVTMGLAPLCLINLVIGGLYIQAGASMRKVVQTEGNDVELFLNGLEKLASAFKVEVIVTIVGMIVGFIGAIYLIGVAG